MSVKVADFSLSRALHHETKRASTVVMANPVRKPVGGAALA